MRHQHRQGKGSNARVTPPLYTVEQAQTALQLLKPVSYGEELQPVENVRVRFRDAGHILGSSWIEVSVNGRDKPRKLIFSGDLGMPGHPVLRDPEKPATHADLLLVESTYGNRQHRSVAETEDEIVAAFERTRATHGNLIIPSFAVGRTQEIIYILADLVRRQRLEPLKVFVDSPMARSATRITMEHPELFDSETKALLRWIQAHPGQVRVEFVGSANDSRALNEVRSGAVIISASGMCEAGRIKYHLRENLPRSECTILIAGFQAAGTLGRRLVDGARLVRIFGQQVPVRAKICTVGGLSAHADQATLIDWLRGFTRPPGQTCVVHGEVGNAVAFVDAIGEQLGWKNVHAPKRGDFVAF